MFNAMSPGFLRPENLWKDFFVEKAKSGVSGTGRKGITYDTAGAEVVHAALAQADQKEQERFKQLGHPISHTIVHPGARKAAADDRLVLCGRYFYVQGTDDPGGLGIWAIYYAEERRDVDGGK